MKNGWYNMVNKDKSVVKCYVFYYPILSNYKGDKCYKKDPRALIQIPTKTGWDFREIPSRFLTKQENENI